MHPIAKQCEDPHSAKMEAKQNGRQQEEESTVMLLSRNGEEVLDVL